MLLLNFSIHQAGSLQQGYGKLLQGSRHVRHICRYTFHGCGGMLQLLKKLAAFLTPVGHQQLTFCAQKLQEYDGHDYHRHTGAAGGGEGSELLAKAVQAALKPFEDYVRTSR